jgi:hypothetical protein
MAPFGMRYINAIRNMPGAQQCRDAAFLHIQVDRLQNLRHMHLKSPTSNLNMIRVCESTPRSGMALRRPFLRQSFPL